MNNSILIGKYIYQFLTGDTAVNAIVSGNVFPVVADVEVNYPFVAYMRTGINADYTKDGQSCDTVTVNIVCVADNYTASVDLANAVRAALDGKRYADDSVNIRQIKMDGATENFLDDAFVQELTFEIIIT